MPIEYLRYDKIDKQKWDACITNASNGLVYAYSFYLDAMAEHWDALVLNDYEAVMPLTWNVKYGIHYLYQPFFTASLGVFSTATIPPSTLDSFLKAIPSKFRYWDIYLNHGNFFPLRDFDLHQRMNYILPLDKSYEGLFSNFRENVKRNVKKADQLKCVIKKNIAVEEVIVLSKEQSKTISPITNDVFIRFTKLYEKLYAQQKAITYGVYDPTHQLVASAVFFFSHNRAYYILVGNHPNSKATGASHALIDAFIKDNAGQNIVLDFEGSDIGGIAFFYSSFGATEEKYCGLKLNRLPLLMKWVKK